MRLATGLFLVTLGLVLATTAGAQLNGSYTIDPAGSGSRNFASFNAAVAALNAGVSGAVTFQVAPVTFKETVTLNPISGASSTATVTFAAAGNPATLDAGGAQDALTLNNLTAWVNFANLKIVNWTRNGIWLSGQSSGPGVNNTTFTNVESNGPASGSTSVRALSLDASDSNTFTNCIFRCGGAPLYHSVSDKNVYESCEFDGMNQAQWVAFFINNNDSDNVIQNCFIHSTSASSSAVALYLKASSFGNMAFHNTILCDTAGTAVQMGGNDRNWGSANGFKNNIVVNLGSGLLMEYWYWNIGSTPSNIITPCVTDHNCFYCPNNSQYLLVKGFSPQTTMFQGNLAAFRTWQQTSPSPIWPGGATGYDLNSIEIDPALTSPTSPFDIHLQAASPCLDAGTNTYVEAYQSFNASHAVPTDFEGNPRGTLVDIGADEVAVNLVGSGSGQPGSAIVFTLQSAGDPGLPYQMGKLVRKRPHPDRHAATRAERG